LPTLANPLGLLALLGIPAVLAIHFLQRKAVEFPVATLFLLERTRREAASGRKLDRLIPSIPLWMQLLAVLLLTWWLTEPRFQKSGSVQRVAIVVDSSASMMVFKDQAIARLGKELAALRGAAAGIEFTVLESAPDRPRLYTGTSMDELATKLKAWKPDTGMIDPTASLRLARSLVSRDGSVIYLTDTPVEQLPFEASLLAVGEAIGNVGFTGVTFAKEEGTLVWRALVRNYDDKPAKRTWSLQTSAGTSEPRELELAPNALVTLQAAFPANAEQVRVVLSADRFTTDDVLPLVAPKPKALTLFTATSPAFAKLTEKLLASLEAIEPSTDSATADLAIFSYDPLDPVTREGSSILFVEDATSAGSYLKGGIIVESHPLMNGLNWQSMLVRETLELDRRTTDKVLLWQEKRPLIFLRESDGHSSLCFNFDLRLSNADKLPAFIVLLHRFAERIRFAKIAPASENLETGQAIRLASAPDAPLRINAFDANGKPLPGSQKLAAQALPGFLRVQQNESTLLDAAIHFADTREADFSTCGESGPLESTGKDSLENHTVPDPWWRVWLLLLLAALLISWKFTARSAEPVCS